MSCIRCGDATEESAYLCEACAEACYQDPVFFFAPNLIGESLVERLRHQSAALIRLDPTPGGDIDRVPGQSFFDAVTDFNVKKASRAVNMNVICLDYSQVFPRLPKCLNCLIEVGSL